MSLAPEPTAPHELDAGNRSGACEAHAETAVAAAREPAEPATDGRHLRPLCGWGRYPDGALKNVGPAMEVPPRRVGGATYQVPMEVSSDRRTTLAIRWIQSAARERSGKSFSDKLAAELIDAFNETGAAIRKRDETHKMAEANRAFSHYRI